jgi:flavin-dependent dehydrogenase
MNTNERIQSNYDAIIIGARCAGAATAMLLARAGLRVLAIDRSRYGSDTLSTNALMRGGVQQLHRWGLLERLKAEGAPTIRSTSFHYGDQSIDIAIKPRGRIDGLYAPRRTLLDRLLVDAAREAGAQVVHGVRAVDLVRSADGSISGAMIEAPGKNVEAPRAGIVIGADGMRSRLARWVDAQPYRTGCHATANIYGYWSDIDVDGYHWYYRPGVSAGLIPTDHGVCLFASLPERRFRDELGDGLEAIYRRVLDEASPEIETALSGASRMGSLWAFPGQAGFLRRSAGPGWALVGDAGFFKDPLTAHGITDALRDAELLARAVVGRDGGLESYEASRDEFAVDMLDVTDEIASFQWDLENIQELHLRLSKEMNREAQMLAGLDSQAVGDAA